MALPKASKTRLQIRQAIGYNLGAIIVGTVTTTGDTSSLIDAYSLAKGGTNDYKGNQIQMNTATQAAIVGEKSFVTSFASGDCTIAPTLTAATTKDDTYEMWKAPFILEEVNDKINQAIIGATDDILVDKETHTTVKEKNRYEYNCLSSFVGLHRVEYVYDTKTDHQLHSCDAVWDELVDGDVTASADEDNEKEGSACLSLAVAAGCAAGDILATDDITSVDLQDYDEVVLWVYSTTALDAGDIQVLLDDTAQCTSALESLDIPATSANTWTRHAISLANPTTDIDIISAGLKMVVDKTTFTLKVDDIRAQNSKSRIYRELNPNLWSIVKASTPLLKLDQDGYSVVANNKFLRLTGYAIPAELSADATTCDIDPDYVIARVTALMMMAHAGGREVDVDERLRRADWWMAISEKRLREGRTTPQPNTRWTS